MNEPTVKVVCDAGPIIHLDELNCLDLLADFEEIIIPAAVEKEIKRHKLSALKSADLKLKRWTKGVTIEKKLLTFCQIFSLDSGETEALALMEKNPNAMFLTDDAAARLVAEQIGYKTHGTIGIIIRSIRRGQKKSEEVLEILSGIPLRSTLYVKQCLLENILHKIKNEFTL